MTNKKTLFWFQVDDRPERSIANLQTLKKRGGPTAPAGYTQRMSYRRMTLFFNDAQTAKDLLDQWTTRNPGAVITGQSTILERTGQTPTRTEDAGQNHDDAELPAKRQTAAGIPAKTTSEEEPE